MKPINAQNQIVRVSLPDSRAALEQLRVVLARGHVTQERRPEDFVTSLSIGTVGGFDCIVAKYTEGVSKEEVETALAQMAAKLGLSIPIVVELTAATPVELPASVTRPQMPPIDLPYRPEPVICSLPPRAANATPSKLAIKRIDVTSFESKRSALELRGQLNGSRHEYIVVRFRAGAGFSVALQPFARPETDPRPMTTAEMTQLRTEIRRAIKQPGAHEDLGRMLQDLNVALRPKPKHPKLI